MADNVQLNLGSGGVIAAADEISAGVFAQRVKPVIGADGTGVDVVPVSNGLDTTATGVPAAGLVAQLDDVATGTVTENQFAPVRLSTRRALLVEGVSGGTAQPVSLASVPSHDVTNAGTFAVQVSSALPAGANAIGKLAANSGVDIGDVDVTSLPTTTLAGATKQELDYDTGGGTQNTPLVGIALPGAGGPVAGGTSTNPLRVDPAGTTTQPVSLATNTPVGNVAHDGGDSGAPLKVGAKAETSLSGVTLVADGDRTDLYSGVDGVLIVRKHSNLEDVVQERTTNTDGAATAFASGLAAPGAGVRLWITHVTICNSSATFCTVDLRDGSAGSVLWTLPVPATGGCIQTFDPPLRVTANTALAFDASAAVSTVTISANGFKSKV